MDNPYYHLIINHFPIIGTLVGILLIFFGIINRSRPLLYAALITFIISAITAGGAFLTGEIAEEGVKNLPEFSLYLIQQHEAWAKLATWTIIGIGILALPATILIRKKHRNALTLCYLLLLIGLPALYFLYMTGKTGGIIRHNEIRTHQDQSNAALPASEDDE